MLSELAPLELHEQPKHWSSEELQRWRDLTNGLLECFYAVGEVGLSALHGLTPEKTVLRGGGGDDDEDEDEEQGDDDRLEGIDQLMTVSCWLAMKEVAITLGTLVRQLPFSVEVAVAPASLLTFEQVSAAGSFLLKMMFGTVHNGAMEKTRVGVLYVAETLLLHPSVKVQQLPLSWINDLLAMVHRDDLKSTRRSRHLAFTIMAILHAEPSGKPRILLPLAVQRLMSVARAEEEVGSARVHSLNVLRQLVMNGDLSLAISIYIPDLFMIAIDGFSAPDWHIRNSATMLFSVLANRCFGTGTIGRSSLTAAEFFARFPVLYPFLKQQLVLSVAEPSADGKADVQLHSRLQPVLLLLSRLVPSAISSEECASLDEFVPHIDKCVHLRGHMSRMMAARALVPVLSPMQLPAFFERKLAELPATGPIRNNNFVHGRLLQVVAALDARFGQEGERDLPSESLCKLVHTLWRQLREKLWLGTSASVADPVRLLYWQIVRTLVRGPTAEGRVPTDEWKRSLPVDALAACSAASLHLWGAVERVEGVRIGSAQLRATTAEVWLLCLEAHVLRDPGAPTSAFWCDRIK